MGEYTPPVRRVDRGRGHTYQDANGLRIPGVTTILKALPKDALINWAGNATAEAAVNRWDEFAAMPPAARLKALARARYDDRDTAGDRGTLVHALASRLVHGEQVSVPEELEGHVQSYVRFLDEFDVRPLLVETVVMSHQHGYAGTLDLVADLLDPDDPEPDPADRDRVRWLLDVKTSRSGVFGETALQLAGYRFADSYVDEAGDELAMPDVDRCGAVWVRGDGYDLIPVEAELDQHRDLLYVQQVARFDAGARDLIGDPVVPPATSTYRLVREDLP